MMFHFDATLNMRHKASAMIFYFDATLDLRHKACAMMFLPACDDVFYILCNDGCCCWPELF